MEQGIARRRKESTEKEVESHESMGV
jgi:hypothetical protein